MRDRLRRMIYGELKAPPLSKATNNSSAAPKSPEKKVTPAAPTIQQPITVPNRRSTAGFVGTQLGGFVGTPPADDMPAVLRDYRLLDDDVSRIGTDPLRIQPAPAQASSARGIDPGATDEAAVSEEQSKRTCGCWR